MIISYRHTFVFIKTKKTAGSSMEIALASHAGPDDVVTPLGFSQDVERNRAWPGALPRNFSSDKAGELALADAIKREDKQAVKAIVREELRSAKKILANRHGSASEAREVAGNEFWRSAFKFTVERHPYEKAVSLAWFRAGSKGEFGEALEEVLEIGGYRNFDLYTINGQLAVDFVIRYENMAADVARVEQAVGGLAILSRLALANSHQRRDRRAAREILTASQRERVQQTCREEFKMFDYEP